MRVRAVPKRRIDFHHHMILIQFRVDRGHLPLSERVVERIVDRQRRNSQPRSRIAVNHQGRLQSARLLIAGNVAQFGQLLHRGLHSRRPFQQVIEIFTGQRVLILRTADPPAHRDVLIRPQKKRGSGNLPQVWAAGGRSLDTQLTFRSLERLQFDFHLRPYFPRRRPFRRPCSSTAGSLRTMSVILFQFLLHHGKGSILRSQNISRPSARYPAAGKIPWE